MKTGKLNEMFNCRARPGFEPGTSKNPNNNEPTISRGFLQKSFFNKRFIISAIILIISSSQLVRKNTDLVELVTQTQFIVV